MYPKPGPCRLGREPDGRGEPGLSSWKESGVSVDENVVIYHLPTVLIARTACDLAPSKQDLVWPRSRSEFRSAFKRLTAFFKLKDTFRPYSLRRGGATEDFRVHGLMERSLLRGRWGSSFAARQYIQEGLSMLTKLSLSPHTLALLHRYRPLMAP